MADFWNFSQKKYLRLADQLNFIHMDPHIFNSMEFNIDLCLIQPSGQTINFCKK